MICKLRTRAVCTRSDTTPPTVQKYAKLGLIDAERDSNGNWLFSEAAPDQVVRIKAKNMGRGRVRKPR